jgi:hypothetical protein
VRIRIRIRTVPARTRFFASSRTLSPRYCIVRTRTEQYSGSNIKVPSFLSFEFIGSLKTSSFVSCVRVRKNVRYDGNIKQVCYRLDSSFFWRLDAGVVSYGFSGERVKKKKLLFLDFLERCCTLLRTTREFASHRIYMRCEGNSRVGIC